MAPKPGIYRHYKGGLYRVLFTVRHHETEREHVVYVSLEHGSVRLRELESANTDDMHPEVNAWNKPVVIGTTTVERFKFVSE